MEWLSISSIVSAKPFILFEVCEHSIVCERLQWVKIKLIDFSSSKDIYCNRTPILTLNHHYGLHTQFEIYINYENRTRMHLAIYSTTKKYIEHCEICIFHPTHARTQILIPLSKWISIFFFINWISGAAVCLFLKKDFF